MGTDKVGYLRGFFDCAASKDARISILSQDYVKAKYEISYEQRKSMTVHMCSKDLVLTKKN